jgi:hypothetical protein
MKTFRLSRRERDFLKSFKYLFAPIAVGTYKGEVIFVKKRWLFKGFKITKRVMTFYCYQDSSDCLMSVVKITTSLKKTERFLYKKFKIRIKL